jgi:hypothetical protein
MRKAALGLALVATTQLTVFSSPALAEDTWASLMPPNANETVAAPSAPAPRYPSSRHKTTGIVLLGVGGAVAVTGLVIDIVGTSQGSVSGQGGAGDSGTTSNARTNFYSAGTLLLVAGVVTGIVGGSFLLRRDQPAPAAIPPVGEGTVDAVTKTAQAATQRSAGFSIPVLGATF